MDGKEGLAISNTGARRTLWGEDWVEKIGGYRLTFRCPRLVVGKRPTLRPGAIGRLQENGLVGVGLDVLLQVLGPLEGLAAEVALVRLERDVDADVGGDVVALDGGGAAGTPQALQVEVVGALATDMSLADVFL